MRTSGLLWTIRIVVTLSIVVALAECGSSGPTRPRDTPGGSRVVSTTIREGMPDG